MNKYVKDMTVGSPVKLILTFMIPLVIGNIFQQFYNMVDSMIVGKYVGADALAAVGATGSLNFLFFSLCAGMANGIGITMSQHFGAGDEDTVKKTIINAAFLMVVCGLLMGTLGFTLTYPALRLLNTPANIIDSAAVYMRIMSAGVLAVAFYNCIAAMLRALGDSKTPLYFLVIASIINVGLDLLFVRKFDMGVAGVGIATIISQLISGIGSLIFAIIKNPYFKIERKHIRIDKNIISQSIRIGVPLAFQTSLIAISCVCLQRVVNGFGSVVIAAFTATSRIEQLVQQPYNSLSMAMSTFSGQNVGAGNFERVKKGFRNGFVIMAIFSLLMIPMAQFFGNNIMRWFVDDLEVIEFGTHALRITSWFYLLLGTIYVCRGLLNGAGDASFAFLNGLIEMAGRICLAKPLTMIPFIGVWGVWLATAMTWGITGIVSYIRYKKGKWMHCSAVGKQ